ncbi:MAG: hypothetical protein IH942_08135 [Acidobacteria bacterium]|nr:hypothetical protein [Acidobacteriota bacterium]
MVESGVDVISDPMFVKGPVAGLIVLALGIVLWGVRGRSDVLRFGGLLVAAATMLVLYQSEMLGLSQLVGVTLLAIAGLFHRGVVAGALFAIPGAFFVIRPEAAEPQSWMPWFAMLAIVFAAPLVASFDDRYPKTGLPMPLFGIAALGVFLAVPDTEGAMVLLGVAGIAGFLGWPRPVATLGAAGSYAVVGLYMFVAAEGAIGRPASIIASVAVLGLLLIVPITIRLRSAGWAHDLDRVVAVVPLVAQLFLVLLISRTAGRIAWVPGAAALTVGVLAGAAMIILLVPWPRPPQFTD